MTGKRPIAPVTTPLSVREPQQLNSEPLAKPLRSRIAAVVDLEPQQQGQEVPASVPGTALTVMPAAMASAHAIVFSSETEPAESVCEIDAVIIPEGLYHKSHTHFEVGRNQTLTLLPAFIPAVQVEATADDHALAESAWIRLYCTAGLDDVVVSFIRPRSAVQKTQQQHPAIEGMTLRAMRELGATLKIKGCRRWNTQQAIEQLTHYYSSKAA